MVATSDPADPTKPITATVSGAKRVLAIYEMTTPGILEARSGDQILSTHHEWDYKAGRVHSVIDNVTAPITFVPKQAGGPWQVALVISPDGGYCLLDENGNPGGFHRNG
ncbi:hypothetical protein [Catelliglobosispora koreensis]|uniref:hypothetical protein n=1 Tax=Catelliglobosispora koreensis TaxID=129052 RepID=UPI00035D4B15|nr:hypothetical protein [Catelliglobosispora koreensis]